MTRTVVLAGSSLAVGIAFLSGQHYTVERCFRIGTMSGCERPVLPFSLEALPSLAIPLLIVAVLSGTAVIVARGGSRWIVVSATIVHAAGSAILLLSGGSVLAIPLLATVAVVLVRLGQQPVRIARDIGTAVAIVLVGMGASYGILVAAMYVRGGFLGSAAPLIAIYIAYAAVVGIGLGLVLAVRGQLSFPIARGMTAASIAAGVAGTLALFLVPPILGRGIVVPGVPLLGGIGLATGTVAARTLFGMRPASALALATGVAFAFGPFLLATLVVLFGMSGPLALMPPLPMVPWLPGTSTE